MRYFISVVFFSISFSIQIMHLNGNINNFSLMDSGTHLEKNNRISDNNIASISFIQLPSNIVYSEFFSEFKYKDISIAPRLGIIDYGTLSSISNDKFNPSESMVEVTVHNNINDIQYSGSIGYIVSKISSYTSSLILYNFGFSSFFLDNRLNLHLSFENNTQTINEYSNVINRYDRYQRLNLKYILQYLPASICLDFLYGRNTFDISSGTKIHLNDYCSIYGAKKFYLSDMQYNFFENIAFGLSVFNSTMQFNFGIQLLSDFNMSYGTSLLMSIK